MYIPDIRNKVPPDPRTGVSGAEQWQQMLPISRVIPHTYSNTFSNPRYHYRYLLAWIIQTVSTAILSDTTTSSPPSRRSLEKRGLSPNALTSLVAGLLVTAFVIFAGIFCYVYRRSIRFRQQGRKRRRHHRHRRRPSGVSKMSQGSDAVAGGGGGGGGAEEAPAPAPDPPAES
ncbi:hypothetical protein RRF57_003366 [Xylaria bambusicola]|uniref:Uncharacterized protein n=1 Tax=Xylaria bambusicola TaxID=326684 RepID=A0AAN7Z7J9_9PEZI